MVSAVTRRRPATEVDHVLVFAIKPYRSGHALSRICSRLTSGAGGTMAERLPISTEHCIVERDGHVVIVTMNRPEARNALSSSMLVGLADAWAYMSDTPEVRVGILTGAEGTFCAGADLKAMGQQPSDPRVRERMAQIPNFHWKGLLREGQPTKPLICAIEGYAVAGGTELLVGTDLRVVAEGATLGL